MRIRYVATTCRPQRAGTKGDVRDVHNIVLGVCTANSKACIVKRVPGILDGSSGTRYHPRGSFPCWIWSSIKSFLTSMTMSSCPAWTVCPCSAA